MSFIGIDLGGTFLKGAWLNPVTNQLGTIHREAFPSFKKGLPEGHREVPVGEIELAVARLLERLLKDESNTCSGLLICGQMHGFVLVRRDHTAASDFITWQDARSLGRGDDGQCHFEVVEASLSADVKISLGNELRPGLPVATLHAMKRSGYSLKSLTPLSLMDFIATRLTGAPPTTHPTNAAAHGLMDVARNEWSQPALESLSLAEIELPRIQSHLTPVGAASLSGRKIPVFVPVGDQQAALYGANLQPGELSVNIATGSQVSTISPFSSAGDWQLRPYFDQTWLRTITHIPAGRALNALLRLCGELAEDQGTPLRDPWEQISRLAANRSPKALLANLAFFPSAYGHQGSLSHLVEDELDVGSLFRAAFRAIAESHAKSARRISPNGWSGIVLSGGLAQKLPVLQAELFDRLGATHRIPEHSEDTLVGLMRLAKRFS